MNFQETGLPGVFVAELKQLQDERGWFERIYCKKEFAKIGFSEEFVQFNQSFNFQKGTFRGMHYQIPPKAEQKLIRCISGSLIDILVDLRKNSLTFLKNIMIPLNALEQKTILCPKGVAHGFVTTADHTSLLYHHTEYYSPEHDKGLRYNDPLLKITIPEAVNVISPKDLSYDLLPSNFEGLQI